MKKCLTTSGTLSVLILFSLFFTFWNYLTPLESFNNDKYIIIKILLYAVLFFLLTISFIMGVVTLVMEKHKIVKKLTIASGVIVIISGLGFASAITSLIIILAMEKYGAIIKGFTIVTIVTIVIAIVGGLSLINAIISFTAIIKINNYENKNNNSKFSTLPNLENN